LKRLSRQIRKSSRLIKLKSEVRSYLARKLLKHPHTSLPSSELEAKIKHVIEEAGLSDDAKRIDKAIEVTLDEIANRAQ
jgi:hypothetical protein